jgi:hypothetical protein
VAVVGVPGPRPRIGLPLPEGPDVSVAYYIVLDKNDTGLDTFVCGKALATDGEALARVAAAASLKTLDEFASQSLEEVEAMREELGLEDLESPEEHWFSVEEGLAWTKALRALVAEDDPTFSDPVAVSAELALWQGLLEKVAETGARWHLSVNF